MSFGDDRHTSALRWSRRRFLASAAPVLSAALAPLHAQTSATPTLYFVDGYHGGAVGHMPPGSWRDILNALRSTPEWKLCLDIEPISWEVLQRSDPGAFRELKSYLDHQPVDARVEMVGATFAQPYGWAISGESNIRQLVRGRNLIRRYFPEAVISTYAVQEPCWASCLPQILLSLGFTGAVLKDPGTAWGGYAAGFDAETVHWVGSDGSSIRTVPRYACEALQKVYETEAATATPEFARKCVEHGIRHPAGMYFQDLGWAAKPKVRGDYIRYVTWREYLEKVADPTTKQWRFGIEDVLTTLPWGEKTLQTVAQQVRAAENRLVMAEKLAAMAWVEQRTDWPSADLEQSWDKLLYAQAHDAWITATTRSGRQAWAFEVASWTQDAESKASQIIAASVGRMLSAAPGPVEAPLGSQVVRVFNTLGCERSELAEVVVSTDRGTHGLQVFDRAGKRVAAQVLVTRKYGAPSASEADLNASVVSFHASIPALGYADYRIEPAAHSVPVEAPLVSAQTGPGEAVLESELYRIKLDPKRGGAITSLFVKKLGKEFCDPSAKYLFNEYRGYFIKLEQWQSSTSNPAQITILENGPLRARVRASGTVGGVPFQTTLTLAAGQPRIDIQTRLTYAEDTWIGDPWDIKPQDRRSERRRSQNDGRWKLQALFPTSFPGRSVFKNAAFDVCKSRNQDTFFQGWDEIKHNILVNWVDVADEQQKLGLAVLSDHTTAYTHGPEHPLALVLGWGWEGGFWWGKCPLRGTQQISYGLIPHAGSWNEARLWEQATRWQEPMVTQIVDGLPARLASHSFAAVSGSGVEVTTLLVESKAVLMRLFHAEAGAPERTVSFFAEPTQVDLVELDGRHIETLPVRRGTQGRFEVEMKIPQFGLRTLRCTFADRPPEKLRRA